MKPLIEEIVNKDFHHSALESTDKEWGAICDITQIVPYVFISGWQQSIDPKMLKAKNIRHILQVIEHKKPQYILDQYKKLRINNVHVPLANLPLEPLKPNLDGTYEFIARCIKMKQSVLVHCSQGVSAAPAIVAYYILRTFYQTRPAKLMLDHVLMEMKKRRPCIDINFGFINQLKDIESELRLKM